MITFLRSLVALALAGVLTVLTLGRVQLNRRGGSTATDEDETGRRPVASEPLERRGGGEGAGSTGGAGAPESPDPRQPAP